MVCYVVSRDYKYWIILRKFGCFFILLLLRKYNIVSFRNYNYIVTQYYELLLIPEPTNSANDKSEGFSLINPSMLPSHFCLPLRQKDHSFLPAFPSFFAQTNQALFLSVFLSIYWTVSLSSYVLLFSVYLSVSVFIIFFVYLSILW